MVNGPSNQLISVTNEQRQDSIRDMIGAYPSNKVRPNSRESLVATRVEIVGELSDDKRRTIISSRHEALKVAPELDQQDRDVQKKILPKISTSTRDKFQATWDEVHGE